MNLQGICSSEGIFTLFLHSLLLITTLQSVAVAFRHRGVDPILRRRWRCRYKHSTDAAPGTRAAALRARERFGTGDALVARSHYRQFEHDAYKEACQSRHCYTTGASDTIGFGLGATHRAECLSANEVDFRCRSITQNMPISVKSPTQRRSWQCTRTSARSTSTNIVGVRNV